MTPTSHQFDETELQGIQAAMLRAAHNAREEARKAGLKIPIWENGVVRWVYPDELTTSQPQDQSQQT